MSEPKYVNILTINYYDDDNDDDRVVDDATTPSTASKGKGSGFI